MVIELHKRGKSIGEIAPDLDIATELVRRWCRVYAATGEGCFVGNVIPVFTPEQREISLLNKALK
jgi:transposase-like protein